MEFLGLVTGREKQETGRAEPAQPVSRLAPPGALANLQTIAPGFNASE